MTQQVIHQPRVAWDAAMAFVQAAGSDQYDAFAGRVYERLGVEVYGELGYTRRRLLMAEAEMPGDQYIFDIEAGKWRVRLQDLMQQRPDVVSTLQELTH
jgi:hypothetical protein